jgi:predicted methyltransferase
MFSLGDFFHSAEREMHCIAILSCTNNLRENQMISRTSRTFSNVVSILLSSIFLMNTGANTVSAAEPVASDGLDKIMAGEHRSEANRARDAFRHPKETLAFFGVKHDSTVIETFPGAGWYTELLAPYLRDKGRLIIAYPAESVRGIKAYQEKLAAKPNLYDKVKIVRIGAPAALDIRPDGANGGADFVLTFRNVHNWIDDDNVDAFMKSFYDALKPGGVLGLVEHRAKPGSKVKEAIDLGYVTEEYVIKHAQMAGFKLDAKSEINANPKDTKDYKGGVWTLPPSLADKEVDRAKYVAIGESDRMTLRFVKPATR